ncbi:MAG: protein kinase [Pirellulaceae bacterium]
MSQSNPALDASSEPDLSNRRLGDYLIGRRLGRGGMADVYLAEQSSLRRQVAFKVLRSSLAKDSTFVRRFHHEAQAAASLVHANIVQIYEVGCIDGVHFIAQEFVDGQNLKQLILRRGKMDVNRAVKIIRQVGAALHKAGQRGIVHRDIKPENILLTAEGEVKVVDFGLARVTNNERRVDLTQVGMTLGTPLYMSPEQVEGQPLDPRSDLYSFGVLCYEMLAGRPPFEGDNAFAVAVQHLKNEPVRLETLRDDLPGGLGRIVHKLLEKKPADRHQSAAEMLRELRAVPFEGQSEWQAAEEDWNTTEWEALATSQMAATQKLATVMLRETRLQGGYRWMLWPVLAVILAFSVGMGLARLTRPPFLLDVAANELPKTPRKGSAKEQFEYAMENAVRSDDIERDLLANERDFLAVEQYFSIDEPQNEEWIRLARFQRAWIYAESGQSEEALQLLADLTSQDADLRLQMNALVLQANLQARANAPEATATVARLVKLMEQTDRFSPRDLSNVSEDLETNRLREQFRNAFPNVFSAPPPRR